MKDESHMNLDRLAIQTLPIGCLTKDYQGSEVAFRIPAYQRGYRWKKEDVTNLLQDLEEFLGLDPSIRPFYCLQPLVVKKARIKSEDKKTEREVWEVVDGQQRLTTLFLIWKVVTGSSPYGLSYETRKRSEDFLQEPTPDQSGRFPYIDFHHIYHAYKTIQDWFESGNKEDKKKEFQALLKNTDLNKPRNVRFIWYQLQEDDDAVAAFTRLNVGKIPLRDEELIRALFLSATGSGRLADGAFQHRLALEWDRIEIALQEPDFWGFLSNEKPPEGGRIRLIFQLCASADLKDSNHELFDYYRGRLSGKDAENPSAVWHEIFECFEQLQEWYRDPELYHLVGYRTTVLNRDRKASRMASRASSFASQNRTTVLNRDRKAREILRELREEAKFSNKQDFARNLRSKIRDELIGIGKSLADFIDDLDYLKNQGPIRPTLALFNIATLLRSHGISMRFPFHSYHRNKWDIEHVHSQGGQDLSKKSDQKVWLQSFFDEIEREKDESDLAYGISKFLQDQPDAPVFDALYRKVGKFFGEDGDSKEVHGIGNLTLLDQSTNRGYGNDPFVMKRAKVLEAYQQGTFILPCTRDLFLKVFSESPGNLRQWDIEADGNAHKDAICKTLESFFSNQVRNPS